MGEMDELQPVDGEGRIRITASGDDVPAEAKLEATRDINDALESTWRGLDIAERFSLENITAAQEWVEHQSVKEQAIASQLFSGQTALSISGAIASRSTA